MSQISHESLNGFAPNSHGRRVWSLTRTSLNVKVKGQGHQRQKLVSWSLTSLFSTNTAISETNQRQKTRCSLPSPPATRNETCLLQVTSRSGRRHHSIAAGGGWFWRPCVRCMFGKTSLALVCIPFCLWISTTVRSTAGHSYILLQLPESKFWI